MVAVLTAELLVNKKLYIDTDYTSCKGPKTVTLLMNDAG